MRAITEIPANTPRPMGSTCSFFPGMANAAVVVDEFSAAAVPDDEIVEEAASDAAVPVAVVVAEVTVAPVSAALEALDDTVTDDVATPPIALSAELEDVAVELEELSVEIVVEAEAETVTEVTG